jgi:hypothetical protein
MVTDSSTSQEKMKENMNSQTNERIKTIRKGTNAKKQNNIYDKMMIL